jgi:uncharacterized membrane protein
MSTASLAPARISRARGKYLIFAFVSVMLAYVLFHNESFLVHSDDPHWSHYRQIWMWLLPHGLAGACALLLAPMQFSDRLRKRYLKLHQVVGYIYVGAVLIAAPMGFFTQFIQESAGMPRSFSFAALTQASSWIITTLVALVLIRQGKITQHRQWMTRSFSVALIFLEVRFIEGVMGWDKLGPGVDETMVWMLNVFALLAADVVLQWQDGWRKRPLPSKAQAAAQ